jgi:hypothetical protein
LAFRAVLVAEVCTPLFGVVVKAEEVWRRRAAVKAKLWNFMVVFFAVDSIDAALSIIDRHACIQHGRKERDRSIEDGTLCSLRALLFVVDVFHRGGMASKISTAGSQVRH